MTPVPLELPLRPAEAAELANLIFDQAELKPLNDDLRNRLAARAATLRLSSITPYFGSLGRDPVHPSAYYLAVDGDMGSPQLLYIALANAPTSSIFHKALLIGRMRRHNGPECVINAIPFGAADFENLEKYASRVDAGFLPRPQGARMTIAVAGDPAAAFEAFRATLKRTGRNVAALSAGPASDGREAYYAGLWAAIRAGWRQEYSAGMEIPFSGGGLESAKEAIRNAPGSSRFAFGGSGMAVEPANRPVLNECDFSNSACPLSSQEAAHMAGKFGGMLKAAEQLREHIRQTRSSLKTGRAFDFELYFDGPDLTTPKELAFCLHWLKARGHAVQLAAPNLGFVEGQPYAVEGVEELFQRVKSLAAVARHYQAILSVRHGGGKAAEVVQAIGKAALGRVSYQISSAGEVRRVAEELVG